jgi:Protein of unknown function (DUF3078)
VVRLCEALIWSGSTFSNVHIDVGFYLDERWVLKKLALCFAVESADKLLYTFATQNKCSMRIALVGVLVAVAVSAHAQDSTVRSLQDQSGREIKHDAADTIPLVWRKGGILGINISQGSLNNWAAGGDKFSLSLNTIASLYAFYKKDRNAWDNTLDFNLGFVRTTSLGTRKNDDRFDLFSKYGYSIAPKWNIAAMGDFRTQFFKGYTYDNNTRTLASDIFAPAYLLLGVGFDYKPTENFSLYLSPLTARWTFVQNDSLSAKGEYGVTPGEKIRSELGAFVSVNYLKTFNKVLAYKGRLDLFSNYKHNPQNVDLYMTNLLSINFTKVLAATWNVDLIYDDDARLFGPNKNLPGLQLKSLVGIGLLLKMGNSKGK